MTTELKLTNDEIKALFVWPDDALQPLPEGGRGLCKFRCGTSMDNLQCGHFANLSYVLEQRPDLDYSWAKRKCEAAGSSYKHVSCIVYDVLELCPELVNLRSILMRINERLFNSQQNDDVYMVAVLIPTIKVIIDAIKQARVQYNELDDFPNYRLSEVAKVIVGFERKADHD